MAIFYLSESSINDYKRIILTESVKIVHISKEDLIKIQDIISKELKKYNYKYIKNNITDSKYDEYLDDAGNKYFHILCINYESQLKNIEVTQEEIDNEPNGKEFVQYEKWIKEFNKNINKIKKDNNLLFKSLNLNITNIQNDIYVYSTKKIEISNNKKTGKFKDLTKDEYGKILSYAKSKLSKYKCLYNLGYIADTSYYKFYKKQKWSYKPLLITKEDIDRYDDNLYKKYRNRQNEISDFKYEIKQYAKSIGLDIKLYGGGSDYIYVDIYIESNMFI